MHHLIKEILNSIPEDVLEVQKTAGFLPPYLYSWITDDEHQLNWLFSQLVNSTDLTKSIKAAQNKDRDFIIGLFDLLDSEPVLPPHQSINHYIQKRLEEKQNKVSHLNKAWEKFSHPQKILEWFNCPQEPERINVGWQIFSKRFPHYTNPFNKFENYSQLLELFDKCNIQLLEREIFVIQARKRYSQNKSREKNTNKKQLNVVLSTTTINTLDKISKKHGLTRGRVIEILLQKEKEKDIYIPEKMRQERDKYEDPEQVTEETNALQI